MKRQILTLFLISFFSILKGQDVDITLFYVDISSTNKLDDISLDISTSLKLKNENCYLFFSNNNSPIPFNNKAEAINFLEKDLYYQNPSKPITSLEINRLNSFISKENIFPFYESNSRFYKTKKIELNFYLTAKSIEEIELQLDNFIHRFLLSNNLILNDQIPDSLMVKVYLNISLANDYLNSELKKNNFRPFTYEFY
jgi:hypothetical protein